MRIVFVNRLLGVRFGGGEQADALYAAELSRRGYDVTVVAGRSILGCRYPKLELASARIVLIRTPYLRDLHYRSKRRQWGGWARNAGYWLGERLDIALFERAVRHWIKVRNVRADWFQISSLPRLAGWIEREGRGRAAVAWHGPVDTVRNAALLNSYTLNWGPGTAYDCLKQFDPHSRHVPNGIEPKRFRRASDKAKLQARQRLSLAPDEIVFLFVGRLVPFKNVELLLEAFAMSARGHPKHGLLVVGEGEAQHSLIGLARNLGVGESVKFLGARYGEALIDAYQAADVFCIFSEHESFSFVVLEAMASSLPVIATRVGFLPSLVDEGRTGLLVDNPSPANLSAAMTQLGFNAPLRQLMGAQAYRAVEVKYPLAASVDALLTAYSEAYVGQ